MTSESHEWALILGSSSGFGAATAVEMARSGMNVFGVHLDLRSTLPNAQRVVAEVEALGRRAVFFNTNAADAAKRAACAGIDSRDAARAGRRRLRARVHALAGVRDAGAVHRRQPEAGGEPAADGDDARRDGEQPRLLGAGPDVAGADASGQPRVRDDELRLDARHQELRAGIGGEGGAGVARPTACVRAGACAASRSTPSARASRIRRRCAR